MKTFIKKLIGHRHENRFSWGEFYWGGKDLAFQYTDGEDHNLLIVKLPFLFKSYIHIGKEKNNYNWNINQEWMYGFYVYNWNDDVVFGWGKHRIRFEFPWMLKWQSTEILDFDRNVLHTTSNKDKNYYKLGGKYDEQYAVKQKIKHQSFNYTYRLNDGSIQNRIATIKCIERRTWGWKWFPWKKYIRTDIDISFNGEVGEKAGSWKGGCIACSYDILPNETPEQCLRRMEQERKF